MRIPFPLWWVAALLYVPAPVLSQPPAARDARPVVARLLELKPVPAAPTDPPIRKLQKERFNARLTAARIQLRAVESGTTSLHDTVPLLVQLALDRADLEERPENLEPWFQLRVDILKEQERLAQTQATSGAMLMADANLATAARADAEIELLRLKESLKKDKK